MSVGTDQRSDELKPPIPEDFRFEILWTLYNNQDYELSAIEIKELLKSHHKSNALLAMLAWCQYNLVHYKEALANINKALEIDENDLNSLGVKACILAEDGIAHGIKANLLHAKQIFLYLADMIDGWVEHYNLGNTLSALGELEQAEKEFKLAIDKNPKKAEIWKNLGNVYFHKGRHKKEIQCYDKALEINPYLVQAIVSKATTLHIIHNEHSKCIQLIEQALKYDINLSYLPCKVHLDIHQTYAAGFQLCGNNCLMSLAG